MGYVLYSLSDSSQPLAAKKNYGGEVRVANAGDGEPWQLDGAHILLDGADVHTLSPQN